MFSKKNDTNTVGKITSLIGAGTSIEGDVRFSGGLRIDGVVKGDVEMSADEIGAVLVVSELARIEGAVKVSRLITNGTIVGSVSVSGLLEMQPKARIVGDVNYLAIEMHQGAVIEGRLVHLASQGEPSAAEAP